MPRVLTPSLPRQARETSGYRVIKNVGATVIPANGLIEITGYDSASDSLKGVRPTGAGLSQALIATTEILVNGFGKVVESGSTVVSYDGSPPAIGGSLGSQSGSNNAIAGTGNMIYLGDRESQKAIVLIDFGGGAGPFAGENTLPQISNFQPPDISFWNNVTTDGKQLKADLSGNNDDSITFRLDVKGGLDGIKISGTKAEEGLINVSVKFLVGTEDPLIWAYLNPSSLTFPINFPEKAAINFTIVGTADVVRGGFSHIWGDYKGAKQTGSGTSAVNFLEDLSPLWDHPLGGLVGSTVNIVGGTGVGQGRVITSFTPTRLFVSPDWTIVPLAFDSSYQITPVGSGLKKVSIPIIIRGQHFATDIGGIKTLTNINEAAGFYFEIESDDAVIGTKTWIGQAGQQFTSEATVQSTGTETTNKIGTITTVLSDAAFVDSTGGWFDGEHVKRLLTMTSGPAIGETAFIAFSSTVPDDRLGLTTSISPIFEVGDNYKITSFPYPNTIKFNDPVIGEIL